MSTGAPELPQHDSMPHILVLVSNIHNVFVISCNGRMYCERDRECVCVCVCVRARVFVFVCVLVFFCAVVFAYRTRSIFSSQYTSAKQLVRGVYGDQKLVPRYENIFSQS